jgi:hypothetical protein
VWRRAGIERTALRASIEATCTRLPCSLHTHRGSGGTVGSKHVNGSMYIVRCRVTGVAPHT